MATIYPGPRLRTVHQDPIDHIEDYLWVIDAVISKIGPDPLSWEDAYQEGYFGLVGAAKDYKPGAAKFPTFAWYQVRWAVQAGKEAARFGKVDTRREYDPTSPRYDAGQAERNPYTALAVANAAHGVGYLPEGWDAADETDILGDMIAAYELDELHALLISTLTETEYDVVSRYFGIGRERQKIREIAADRGTALQTAAQTKLRALNKLRKALVSVR